MTDLNVIPKINEVQYDPTWGELFGAAFRTENTVGSLYQYIDNTRWNAQRDGTYDATPVTDDEVNQAVRDAGLHQYVGHFTNIQTRGDLSNKIAHIRQQSEDRDTLDRGGWSGFGAQLVAGLLDVPTLVPFGHAARLGRLGTETLKTTASKLAITAALDAGVTEAALHATQDLRTSEESAIAVGGSVLLTTLVGTGAARWLSKRHHEDLSARLEKELPKIADGRAEIEVSEQFQKASDNTARAIRGEKMVDDAIPSSVGVEPDVPAGMTRLYRAEDSNAGTSSRESAGSFFTTDRTRTQEYGNNLYYVDVPTADLAKYAHPIRADEHVLPSDVAARKSLLTTENPVSGRVSDLNAMEAKASRALNMQFQDGVLSTSSTQPLTRQQLQGIRNVATQRGVDRTELFVRENADGSVEVRSFKGGARAGSPSFTTAKGSTYEIHADGTTSRNKAARSDVGHEGDFGPKPRTEKTVYVSPEDAQRLAGPDSASWRVIDHGDGTVSLATRNPDGRWGISPDQRNVKTYDKPAVGLAPIELWGKEAVYGKDAYKKIHLGNAITEVKSGADIPGDGWVSLSKYKSAETRVKADDLSGKPPDDPELRQGLPTTRWDGGTKAADTNGAASVDGTGYASSGGEMVARGRQDAAGGQTPPPGGSGTPPRSGGPDEPPKAIGGAYAPDLTPSQLAFADSGGTIAATRGLSRLFGGSPVLELMNSTSTQARRWVMQVAELSARTKGAYEGGVNPIAIQSRMAEYDGMRAVMTRDFNDAYKGWRQGLDIMGRDYENFSRQVSQSIVRNNFDSPSTDPNVAKAAKAVRHVISTMYERAVEQGLIRKDAWKPGDVKDAFVDFNAARAGATDTSSFDPKDAVDAFLLTLASPRQRKTDADGKRANKMTNENPNVNRLTAKDADVVADLARDIERGVAVFADEGGDGFFRETGQRLARGGQTGQRGLDYNVAVKFSFGPNGELGDNLIQQGGLINRRYTDRVHHEREQFLRAEAMADIQDRDFAIRTARKENEAAIRKAREDATARGDNPDEAEKLVDLNPTANGKLWHELNIQNKRSRMFSAINHAKGSWEFIVYGTYRPGSAAAEGIRMVGAGVQRPLHTRNVKLSDQVLLAKGWIDDDALGIANHTVRQIAADVEIARHFRRPMEKFTAAEHGFKNDEITQAKFKRPDAYWVDGADPTTVPDFGMRVPKAAIAKEFDDQLSKLPELPAFDAVRNRIKDERAMVLGGVDANGIYKPGLIDTTLGLLRGTHRPEVNGSRGAQDLVAVRNYIFAARMGANLLTSVSDVSALVSRYGAGDLLSHYAHRSFGLVKSLADPENLGKIAAEWQLPQERVGAILSREARAAGIATETDLMSRMSSQMDLLDPFVNAKAKDTTFRQSADWLARTGSKAYFINVWTNSIRRAAYGIYQDRVIRMAMDRANVSKHERVWLNDLGIDDTLLDAIRYEVTANKGAVLDGGVWHIQSDNWANAGARSDFWAAARKEVNNANVSPTALDKPLGFTNPVVATMMQFWSFSFGATMRILGQNAQRVINGTDGFNSDGARAILGIMASVGVGMGTFALHNYASTWRQRMNGTLDPKDELPDFNENWRQWTLQGFSRSGVGGVFSQMGDVLDNVGFNPAYRVIRSFDEQPELTDPMKKYGRPNAVKNVFGPTAGLIEDMTSAARGIANGSFYENEDVKRSHARAIQRNLPFVNAFYLKSLTKELAEYLNDDVFKLPPDAR